MFSFFQFLFKARPKVSRTAAGQSTTYSFVPELKQMQQQLHTAFRMFPDFVSRELQTEPTLGIYYLSNLVDGDILLQELFHPLLQAVGSMTPEQLVALLPICEPLPEPDWETMQQYLLRGWTYVHLDGSSVGILADTAKVRERSLMKPENESQILGPQIGFSESLQTNIALIQQYLRHPDLCEIGMTLGDLTQTDIRLIYISSRADAAIVKHVYDKLQDLALEALVDTTILVQWLEDSPGSIFPQLITTERVDRAIFPLLEGKIVVVVDGSPHVMVAPSTFLDFFKSIEDYYARWIIGLFLRGLRIIAIGISFYATAIYVAALTYHYEIIPQAVLVPLAQSRARVPFPPLVEALMLETIIQLLSEAGARLPTKVGQTMGIVGGIVIGQAAVQAGFTSNILIIIVALSALSSYTTPILSMAFTIRIIRFPIIISAGVLGLFGMVFSTTLLIIHLLQLSSAGHPYFYPPYAIKTKNKRDGILRIPFPLTPRRSVFANMADNPQKGSSDIDE
ncbi:spore germination protein [Paenibacillus whitsoniae]|uniref:Spore germination protein n=1 Tax=Paenibacillus whitsoniae TaxID=2496558 RepID=A0A430JGE2_9BACL|nr:spore germination protein [Paenibacillus whitsoniae]